MDLTARLYVLKENPYFSSLPWGEARVLVARLREHHYRTGDVIFCKGDRCEGLYIVLSGRVRTSITSMDGREQVLKVFGPGRTFADIPVFDDEPLPADAVAAKDSTVAILSQPDVLDLLKRHAGVIQMSRERIRITDVEALGVWIEFERRVGAEVATDDTGPGHFSTVSASDPGQPPSPCSRMAGR